MTRIQSALAAVVTKHREPLELQELPLPDLSTGDLLIKVGAATLCGSDVHYWEGDESLIVPTPYVPGHESAGTVYELSGQRFDHLGEPIEPGDRVVWSYPFCGHCYYCAVAHQPTLCPDAMRPGRTRSDLAPYLNGSCAQYQYVNAKSALIRIPDAVSFPLAAATSCALRTVMRGVETVPRVGPHETVLVQGAGVVGLFAVAVLRAAGAGTVLLIGNPPSRVQLGLQFGADDAIAMDDFDASARREWVLDHTHGRGTDYVFQCATAMAIGEALDLVRLGGQIVSIGAGGSSTIPTSALVKALTFTSVRSGEPRHFLAALQFVANNPQLPFNQLLNGPYKLESVTEALVALGNLTDLKPVVEPNAA